MKFSRSSYYDRNDTKEEGGYEQRFASTVGIDLHNHTTGDALDYFISCYNDLLESKAIKVIHGYRNGTEIRSRLRSYLKDHSNYLRFKLGEDFDGNAGSTIVYPKHRLPPIHETIEVKILEFCSQARSEEKIFNKFRLYADTEVKKAIRALQRQGKIRSMDQGRLRYYEAITS